MWWYSSSRSWWWLAFVMIVFFIPLRLGWGDRGWEPSYRRRRSFGSAHESVHPAAGQAFDDMKTGRGAFGFLLWFLLIMALIWLITAWTWGGWC